MRFTHRGLSWEGSRRRVLAAMTLISYLATIFGMPLPATARKGGDQPFPCQGNACGCQTAEQCWTSCCCISPEARLAWARARNIEPPPNAEKPGSVRWENLRKRAQSSPSKPPSKCCQSGQCEHSSEESNESHTPCCEHGDESKPTTPCPTEDGEAPSQESEEPTPADESASVTWVLGISALRCQGHGSYLNASPLALPGQPHVQWEPCILLAARLPFVAMTAISFTLAPLDPPPRHSL